jgi:LysR family transcriptional activator of dmlA
MASPLARLPEVVRGMAAIVAVADHGSLAAAAQALALTPSAVSKLVSRAEARLGARLLQRSTRRVVFTDAGLAYCERARRVLAELDAGERELQERDPVPRGTLTVSAPASYGQVRVVPLVLGFQRRYPEVAVRLDLTDRHVDLLEERVDLAVRVTASPPLALVARKLEDDVRVLCASPAYLAARPAPASPAELVDHVCLALLGGGAIQPWPLRDRRAERAVRDRLARAPLALSTILALREAALGGVGIADLPHVLVADDLAAGRLVGVLDGHLAVSRAVYLLHAPTPFLPAKIRAFAEHVLAAFRPPRRR